MTGLNVHSPPFFSYSISSGDLFYLCKFFTLPLSYSAVNTCPLPWLLPLLAYRLCRAAESFPKKFLLSFWLVLGEKVQPSVSAASFSACFCLIFSFDSLPFYIIIIGLSMRLSMIWSV